MPKAINEKFSFRQRGYTCQNCQAVTMTFGNDPDPVTCPTCETAGGIKNTWDHMVNTTTTVEPFAG